jgi:hypothetical protein
VAKKLDAIILGKRPGSEVVAKLLCSRLAGRLR